jgi:hypothetical protein
MSIPNPSRRTVLMGTVAGAAGLLRRPVLGAGRRTARFPGDPGRGLLYYGSHTDYNDPAPREARYGHRVGVSRLFYDYFEIDVLVTAAARDLLAGRQPYVSIYNPGTWQEVAAGIYDDWLDSLLGGLAAVPGPVWLCVYHEPDAGLGYGNTRASYRRMYRRVAARRPANVALAPIVGLYWHDPSMGGGGSRADTWYALDVVDIVGCDTYNHWAPDNPGGARYRSATLCAEYFDVLAEMGKPIALAEYGTRTDPYHPGRADWWMTRFHDILLARGDVVCMSFFDYSLRGHPTPYLLDWQGDTERLDAFNRLLVAPGSVFREVTRLGLR